MLGLLALREGGRLQVHAPTSVRESLALGLRLDAVLDRFCGVNWHEPPVGEYAPLGGPDGSAGSLSYRAIPLPGSPPPFAREWPGSGPHSVAYQFRDARTGGRVLVAPDVAAVTAALAAALAESDVVLFDGTFWSADELVQVKSTAPRAEAMGHLTIRDQSLALLTGLPARRKIYLHINNTNPVLLPESRERAAVERAGIEVGGDGWEFDL